MNRYVITAHGVLANSPALQTAAVQAVLDRCKDSGGTVVIPKGRFRVAALYLHSNTTLYLEAGAELYGSDECDDYEVFPIPEGVQMRSDLEMISEYHGAPWATYRRAIITAYGEKNISIIGECGSVIDGSNCYDANGEEGYRGPHAIFLSSCENVLLEGYTVRHSGNFLHEANNCKNLTMRRVTCLGGSDGIHMHFTQNAIIEDCLFKTGDDCIAGINVQNLTVRHCVLNSSCQLFRLGGVNIKIEKIYGYGPGYYPHRMTVVKGKNQELPREAGRHYLGCAVLYFGSADYPFAPSDITIKDSTFDGPSNVLGYHADGDCLQSGTCLGSFTLENVRFTDLSVPSSPKAKAQTPLVITLKNVVAEFRENVAQKSLFLLREDSYTTIVEK